MRTYKRLTIHEREEISWRKWNNAKNNEIAHALGRDPSTIWRELRRILVPQAVYHASDAQLSAQTKAHVPRKTRKLDTNSRLRRYVLEKLDLRWSPEQIANSLKEHYPQDMHISHESIYSYIYVLPRGSLKQELIACLRHKRRLRRKRGLTHKKRGAIQDMLSIHERPKEVETRIIPGHWEGDLIMGKNHASAVGTLVERTTRTVILVPLKEKDAWSVREAFATELRHLPRKLKLSLTYDRGSEMSEHKLFTKDTRIQVYFADPYAPWQRGTNENTNGLIRQFFPKGTDFRTITRRQIKYVQKLLNERPRKTLHWKTPKEAFQQLLAIET